MSVLHVVPCLSNNTIEMQGKMFEYTDLLQPANWIAHGGKALL